MNDESYSFRYHDIGLNHNPIKFSILFSQPLINRQLYSYSPDSGY